jgi:hypothetical protein
MAGAALSYTTARGLLKQPYKQELARVMDGHLHDRTRFTETTIRAASSRPA